MKTRICLWSYESSFHLVAPMISIHPRTPHPCPRWSWCSRCCDIGYCCVVFVVSHHCLCLCVARLKFIILGSHMCTLTYLIILQYPLLSPCKWIIVHFKYSMIQAEDVSKVMMLVVCGPLWGFNHYKVGVQQAGTGFTFDSMFYVCNRTHFPNAKFFPILWALQSGPCLWCSWQVHLKGILYC